MSDEQWYAQPPPEELSPPGAEAPRETVVGALMRQAFWLSVVYLLVGAGVALVRRFSKALVWSKFAVALDGVSRSLLEAAHLWEPFMRASATGGLPPWAARVILGGLTVGLIHAQALTLAVLLSLARALYLRLART